jgi:hypothetical protein
LLRKKFFVDVLQLFFNPLDLLPRRGALLGIQLYGLRAGEPPMGAIDNRGDHLQIANQFRRWPRRDLLLPLRFEKQPGILQNAFADGGRSAAPGGIQLASLAAIAVMLDENRGHPLAVLQALSCHWHEKLHGHLRRDVPLAHLLLDGFWQQLRQRQPTRNPRHATVELSRQLFQAVAETLFHLG